MYKESSHCRICRNSHLEVVLDLGRQALTGVFPKAGAVVEASPLRLVRCSGGEDACGLLQLQHTCDPLDLYGENYGYRSGLNGSMVRHLHAHVRKALQRVSLPADALIVDIGANDSTTLQAFPVRGTTLVGVDPTAAKFRRFYPPHIELMADFFSVAALKRRFGARKATVITSFAMLYDLDEPLKFVQEVAELLDEHGIWIFEQSYMPAMLRQTSYDTVCHEHLEYYALRQIKWMTERAGLVLVDLEFSDVNGGSFCVTAAKRESGRTESARIARVLADERRGGFETLQPFQDFAHRVEAHKHTVRTFLTTAKERHARVCALGASTKGNVLLQYCGITSQDIAYVGEINPDKWGAFTPGTSIPIIAESEVLAMEPDYLMVLPWHFRDFFLRQPRFSNHTLVFPLPELEVLGSVRAQHERSSQRNVQ